MKQNKKTFYIISILIVLILANIFLIDYADAYNFGGLGDAVNYAGEAEEAAGIGRADPRGIVVALIQQILGLASILFFMIFIYGGYRWMTAGGADEKINKAKTVIRNAIIGLVIVITAYTITYFIAQAIESGATPPAGQGQNPTSIQP